MSPELHRRVRELFDEALERPEAERAAFVQQSARHQPEVLAEVQRLLDARNQAQSFLEPTTHRSDRIDRYLIGAELGRGAMGTVYEGVDPWIGRTLAIKIISLQSSDPKAADFMRDSLFREARSAGVLSHPNIVTVFDVGHENESAFIVMERVEGPTLQHIIDSGNLPQPGEAIEILRQASSALDYAHQNGVVHRDIKPANIMLHKGATVKIADFGIAKLATAQQHTMTGMVMGTPSYMSPDQIEMRKLDGRSDEFSLAAVAFELLTGVKLFQGESLAPLLHGIVYGKRSLAHEANPKLPAAIDTVLDRALRRFPEERYGTCSEFIGALSACFIRNAATEPVVVPPPAPVVPQVTPQPGPPTPQPPPVPAARKSSPILLGAVGLVTVALGVASYKFFGTSNPTDNRPVPPPIAAGPVITRFAADPAAIAPGTSAYLNWIVTGSTDISIDQGVGKVNPGGTFEVKPTASTTYVLTARSTGGTVTSNAAVTVKTPATPPEHTDAPKKTEPPPSTPKTPPTVTTFAAEPASVKRGEHFDLNWTVEGGTQVSIDHGVGRVPSTGTKSLLADATTTYALDAKNAAGNTRKIVTVTVIVESTAELFDRAVAARNSQQVAKALELFRLAAGRGEARAMMELGKDYRSGADGVTKDPAQAVTWFEKAANAGNTSGMVYLASMYVAGEGVARDDRQAASWYEKAANAGSVSGMDAIGQLYNTGRGVSRKDYAQAVKWFTQAAEGGNSSAMYHLAVNYENGWGVAKNMSQAASWYRKAAAGGDAAARNRLANLPKTSAAETESPRKLTARVPANQAWSDTGIDLKQGDQVTITASGTIRASADSRLSPASPDGLLTNCSGAAKLYGHEAGVFPAPNLPCWSLLGRITGGKSSTFEIGANKTFTAPAAGRLYLGPNDDNAADNSGAWTAIITVTSR